MDEMPEDNTQKLGKDSLSRRNFLELCIGAAAGLLAVTSISYSEENSNLYELNFYEHKPLKDGDITPDFSAVSIDGIEIRLSNYRGKNSVFLYFWAPEVDYELPEVKALYEEYKDKGLVVIGVYCDKDKKGLEKYVKEYNFGYPQIDQSMNFKGRGGILPIIFGLSYIPNGVVINREGVIVSKGENIKGVKNFKSFKKEILVVLEKQ